MLHNYQSRAEYSGDSGLWPGMVLLPDDGQRAAGAVVEREHCVCGFSASGTGHSMHDYLPHVFILRGRRLLYSHGIYALTGFTAVILILFGGVTDRLIPLYAIGAFLAFTLSQAGMVVHWLKMEKHPGRLWHMFVNGFGAVATGITTLVVLVAKFWQGPG